MSHLYHVVSNNIQIQGEVPFTGADRLSFRGYIIIDAFLFFGTVLHRNPVASPPITFVLARRGWTEPLLASFGAQLGIPPDQLHLIIVRDGFSQVHILQNDQGIKVSSALLPFDALTANPSSRTTLLSLSNLYMIVFNSAHNPRRLFHNADQYMTDMVLLLNSFNTLRHVVLPLDLSGRTTSILVALRGHPQLSILDLRLPESYAPTSDDIRRFRLLLAVELFGFQQIQTLVIQTQLVDWMVIANLASLEGLEDLHITSQDNEGGDGFVDALLNLGNEPFIDGFTRLRTINVDVNNTSSWAVAILQHIFPDVQIL
jgi:hypothetical protein